MFINFNWRRERIFPVISESKRAIRLACTRAHGENASRISFDEIERKGLEELFHARQRSRTNDQLGRRCNTG